MWRVRQACLGLQARSTSRSRCVSEERCPAGLLKHAVSGSPEPCSSRVRQACRPAQKVCPSFSRVPRASFVSCSNRSSSSASSWQRLDVADPSNGPNLMAMILWVLAPGWRGGSSLVLDKPLNSLCKSGNVNWRDEDQHSGLGAVFVPLYSMQFGTARHVASSVAVPNNALETRKDKKGTVFRKPDEHVTSEVHLRLHRGPRLTSRCHGLAIFPHMTEWSVDQPSRSAAPLKRRLQPRSSP